MADRPIKLQGGLVLDQSLIDELSAEAERGYDLTNARRVFLREGRPSRGEAAGESPRIASRVPRSVYLAARKRADREGLTVSQVVRALLAGYAAGRPSRSPRRPNRADVVGATDKQADGASRRAPRRSPSARNKSRLATRTRAADVDRSQSSSTRSRRI